MLRDKLKKNVARITGPLRNWVERIIHLITGPAEGNSQSVLFSGESRTGIRSVAALESL